MFQISSYGSCKPSWCSSRRHSTQCFQAGRTSCRRGRSLTQKTYAVGWDPEGILSAPQGGHISRRFLAKEVERNKELQTEVDRLKKEKNEELQQQRDARPVPSTQAELIDYFLETESGEMQYEAARMRPLITDDWFSFLAKTISEARFSSSPDEGRIAELESLQTFLKEATGLIDARTRTLSAPAERLRKLLSAKDKKAMLNEMGGNNEIDKTLLELLEQNISAARAAGQNDPAVFMEKIRDAAKKFVLSPSSKS